MCGMAQRMHDMTQRQIFVYESSIDASESSTTTEAKMIVPCQLHVIGIQQPIEVVMQSSDLNDKLIALLESIEVNLMLKVIKTVLTMKENQMSVSTQPCSTILLVDIL
jgi:hypothetical protein